MEQTSAPKGMDIARDLYESVGKDMIHEKFPEYEDRIATGLVGEGSECFGYDDSQSWDHDFGAGFCMWLTDEDFGAIGERLQAEYAGLADKYDRYPVKADSELGGHRIGVWRISDFYAHFLGGEVIPADLMSWLRLPDSYLAVATNGEVFSDPYGEFTRIRDRLKAGYPADIRIKKMSARMAEMSRAGQYNYPRALNRGESVAAELALTEFIRNGMQLVYLINNRYAPFDKWMHRGIKELPKLEDTYDDFSLLADGTRDVREKVRVIEDICGKCAMGLHAERLIDSDEPFLQAHLPRMAANIEDTTIRSLPWLAG